MSRRLKMKRRLRKAEKLKNRYDTERPYPKSNYADIVKNNEMFIDYYKKQGIVDESKWNEFIECLRSDLQSSFRINSCCGGQTKKLKSIITGKEFWSLTVDNDDENGDKKEFKKAITPLIWDPKGLAFQLNFSRVEIRRQESLMKLHHFLISESENGYITRQEAVSMIPPMVLDIKPHHYVLDSCASPGSKTAQIIEMLQTPLNDLVNIEENLKMGMVVANDIDSKRCYMLVHQSKRLHSPCFIISNHDAANMPYLYREEDGERKLMKFDRVLADVPCTGDGTLRKNLDVWVKWNIANGNNFHGLQLKIARKNLEQLKKDGLMAYSTCSMNPIEDEAVIAALLNMSNGGVELVEVSDRLPGLKFSPGLSKWKVIDKDGNIMESMEAIPEDRLTQFKNTMFPPENSEKLHLERCMRILPNLQNTGGFFVAVLKKTVEHLPWEKTDEAILEEFKEGKFQAIADGPPNKKRRNTGFREDPFYQLEANSEEWQNIKAFYDISDQFPVEQLVSRSPVARRNIYFLTRAAKDAIIYNEANVKIVNAGVRMFTKIDDKVSDCRYRITQEGLPVIFPFLNPKRFVFVNHEEFNRLLVHESTQTDSLNEEAVASLQSIPSGCCTIVHKVSFVDNDGHPQDMTLALSAWKGVKTVRPFVSKQERIHFLRMCDMQTAELEKEASDRFLEKQEKRKQRVEDRKTNGSDNETNQEIKTEKNDSE